MEFMEVQRARTLLRDVLARSHEGSNDLSHAMEALDSDPAISAMVLTGSEKAFAAGADIKEMAPKSYMVRVQESMSLQQVCVYYFLCEYALKSADRQMRLPFRSFPTYNRTRRRRMSSRAVYSLPPPLPILALLSYLRHAPQVLPLLCLLFIRTTTLAIGYQIGASSATVASR